MELINRSFNSVNEHTYVFNHITNGLLICKEWVNYSGKCIDFTLTDKDGNAIDDDALIEQVQIFIDNQQVII
jgi:hypothetical protein